MTISYNLTGTERKALVTAISQELNATAKYLGMPTAAYEVGEYTIDKTGTVTGPDNRTLVADLQGLHSLVPDCEEYDAPETETADEAYPDIDQHHPGRYSAEPPSDEMLQHAASWMEGMPEYEGLNMTEREELGLGQTCTDYPGEDGMQASDVPDEDIPDEEAGETGSEAETMTDIETGRLAIEMPKDGFTEAAIENLRKLVESKAGLIKKSVGSDCLPVEETETTLRFAWFASDSAPEAVSAYTHFITALCLMAKEQKRITAKEKAVDNEKYAFRCFLLRLGFIGEEFKEARKILLANMEGNGSFKSGERKPAANAESNPEANGETLPDETHNDDYGVVPTEETAASPDEKVPA